MALLFDLAALSARHTDEVLHHVFCKAYGHEDGDGIWAPQDNPFLARLVELFTERGLTRMAGLSDELQAWLTGERHQAGDIRPRPPGDRRVWTQQELGVARLYLRSLPPSAWTIDDHMLLVDFLHQRYMSADDLRTEAEWLSQRSVLMGRVQANMAAVTPGQADKILAAPIPDVSWSGIQQQVREFARLRCADAVTRVSEGVRMQLRQTISQEVEQASLAGRPVWSTALQTRLQDDFAIQNRDWRRVALTESGEALNQGFIASLPPDQMVKRVEQYKGVCPYCAKIDGRVMRVTTADDPDKDGETDVWPGKNNVGRSASPRKRVGDLLVPRDPDELYWVPAGLAHPNCRGRYVQVITDQPGDDPEFGDWLRETLQGAKPQA